MAKNNDVRCARGVLRRAYIVMEVHHFECARIRQIVKSRRIVKKHRPSRGACERSKQLDPA